MKNIKKLAKLGSASTLIVALAAIAGFRGDAVAQEKGAELLVKPSRQQSTPAAHATVSPTAHRVCPKCQDVVIQVPDRDAKGAQALLAAGSPTKPVVRHQCPGCNTEIRTIGVGKNAKDIVKHACTESGGAAASCCATN